MPYTIDFRSVLEQRHVVELESAYARRRHVHPPDHRAIVCELMARMAVASLGATIPAMSGGGCAKAGEGPVERNASEEESEAAMAADLAVFESGERLKAAVDDAQLNALARLHATARAELDARHAQSWVDRTPLSADDAVVREVATATGLSVSDVGLRLELATGAPTRAAFLREQVATGATTLHRACQLVSATRHLPDDLLDDVVRAVLAPTRDGAGLPPARFRQRLRRALVAADTAAGTEADTRKAARQRIGAFARLYDDGTGTLSVTNDAEKIAAAYDRADAAARAARQAGDPRTLDELRADFLTGAAMTGWPDERRFPPTPAPGPDDSCAKADSNGQRPARPDVATDDDETAIPHERPDDDPPCSTAHRATPFREGEAAGSAAEGRQPDAAPEPPGPGADPDGHPPASRARFGPVGAHPPARAWIVVPWSTAAGFDDQPCELPGHGWVGAAHARQIITAEGSVWQTLLSDVDTGRALALSRRGYRPSAEMIEHVRAVDGTCRAPGCDVLAHRCDVDHSKGFDHRDPSATTDVRELGALDRPHHRLRTAGLWSAVRDPDGVVAWRTGAGRRYLTYPRDWLDGQRGAPTSRTARAVRTAGATTRNAGAATGSTRTASAPTPPVEPPPF